jgi:glycerol-3-phosphate dehydrogenase
LANTGDSNRNLQLAANSLILDHEKLSRISGIVTVNGVKYTTAVELAKDAVHLVFEKLGLEKEAEYASDTKLPGAVNVSSEEDIVFRDHHKFRIPLNTIDHLKQIYGTQYLSILDLVIDNKRLAETIYRRSPTIKAEIVHAIRSEMAQHLSDVVIRRTDLASTGDPGSEAVEKCAEIMGNELNWDETRRRTEVNNVHAALRLQ